VTGPGMPSRFGSEPAPPEELFSRIRAAVEATPASRRRIGLRVSLAIAVAPVITAAVLFIASRLIFARPALRADVAARSTSELLVELSLLLVLTFSATGVAFARGERGFGRGAVSLSLLALLVTPIYAGLVLGPLRSSGATMTSLPLSPWGVRCLGVAAAVGLLVLAGFAIALRRAAAVASRVRGAALGAAAGAWAGLAVFSFCPAHELRHLLIGHVMPIAAFTLLGLAAIPRFLRP
jgi:hypothetical protein